MSNDKEIHKLFKVNKKELTDKGFSRQVISKLPERYNILAEGFRLCCILFALIFPFMIELPAFMDLFNNWVTTLIPLDSIYFLSLQIGVGSIFLAGLVVFLVEEFD